MSDPFIGQLMFAGFNFAPRQYANCDGGRLTPTQFGALYALLGTTYGGDGSSYFLLPDLRGRSPFGGTASIDANWAPPQTVPGQSQGSESVTLTIGQIPAHSHGIAVSTDSGNNQNATGRTFGVAPGPMYGSAPSQGQSINLGGSPMTNVGSNGAHSNMQPFTVIEIAIALTGLFPTRA